MYALYVQELTPFSFYKRNKGQKPTSLYVKNPTLKPLTLQRIWSTLKG